MVGSRKMAASESRGAAAATVQRCCSQASLASPSKDRCRLGRCSSSRRGFLARAQRSGGRAVPRASTQRPLPTVWRQAVRSRSPRACRGGNCLPTSTPAFCRSSTSLRAYASIGSRPPQTPSRALRLISARGAWGDGNRSGPAASRSLVLATSCGSGCAPSCARTPRCPRSGASASSNRVDLRRRGASRPAERRLDSYSA